MKKEVSVGEKLHQLEQEIVPFKPALSKAADAILEQEISKYPIFVVHQQTIDIGIGLINPEGDQGKWTIHASTLEEFATRQLIKAEKVENFKKVYKNPLTHLCLFILSDLGATFVFIERA